MKHLTRLTEQKVRNKSYRTKQKDAETETLGNIR